jgi:hypothetical protein
MRRVIFALPLFCLVLQLGTIYAMRSRLGRLRSELTSARKEYRLLQGQITEANRKQKQLSRKPSAS